MQPLSTSFDVFQLVSIHVEEVDPLNVCDFKAMLNVTHLHLNRRSLLASRNIHFHLVTLTTMLRNNSS